MYVTLAYIVAAILLSFLAFLFVQTNRDIEKLEQEDYVKDLLTERFGRFPYNQRKLLPLRMYLSVEMLPKYEWMRLNGRKPMDIQLEIQRDADRFLQAKPE